VFLRHTRQLVRARDAAVARHLKPQFIVEFEKLKQGLQRVVAIRPPAGDMQKKIELGRGRPGCRSE
jgi:hypothetical protein